MARVTTPIAAGVSLGVIAVASSGGEVRLRAWVVNVSIIGSSGDGARPRRHSGPENEQGIDLPGRLRRRVGTLAVWSALERVRREPRAEVRGLS